MQIQFELSMASKKKSEKQQASKFKNNEVKIELHILTKNTSLDIDVSFLVTFSLKMPEEHPKRILKDSLLMFFR